MAKKDTLKIIPLGGLGEVGKNMTLLEYKDEILIVDMGLTFPTESTPGIDYIIPNISYLEESDKKIVGAIFTHGHMDHIGAVPYIIDRLGNSYPMFAGRLTKELILNRQEEFPYEKKLKITEVKDGQKEKIGPFQVRFVRMNHSILDTFGLLIKTPAGTIFHTSDFKFDTKPVFDKKTDFKKFEKIGKEGVDLLMSDSTGAEEEGSALSEKEIMENLDEIFKESEGRIIVSTFSSLLNRIQQVIKLSEKHNRKVAINGRSMRTNVKIAQDLGYLEIKKGQRIDVRHIGRYKPSEVTIICTGAQGEEMAALSRITRGEHRQIKLQVSDSVILSSSIIPGNEIAVQDLKDSILREGANVYHYRMMDVHSSGHAKQDDLVKMMKMIKPKYLLPVHGEYSMLKRLSDLAVKRGGISSKNAIVAENGDVVSLDKSGISIEKDKVKTSYILVDGLGVGDVGKIVLRDRERLAEDGIFVVIIVLDHKTGKLQNSPDIISRGFVYLRESKDLLAETRKKVVKIANRASQRSADDESIKKEIREKIASYLYSKTERRPMVLPVVIKV